MTQRVNALIRNAVLAATTLAAIITLIFWSTMVPDEAWFLNRPTSWWSERLAQDYCGSGAASDMDAVIQPPTPSPPVSAIQKALYLTLTPIGFRIGADPAGDEILNPGIEAIPVLAKLLHDKKLCVRCCAEMALNRLAGQVIARNLTSNDIIKALQEAACKDRTDESRERIQSVIKNIEQLVAWLNAHSERRAGALRKAGENKKTH